jgi:MFS family permease
LVHHRPGEDVEDAHPRRQVEGGADQDEECVGHVHEHPEVWDHQGQRRGGYPREAEQRSARYPAFSRSGQQHGNGRAHQPKDSDHRRAGLCGYTGLLLAVFALVQVPSAFLFPVLADRSGDRRPWLALTLILATFGFCAAGLVPLVTPWAPWVWVVVLGSGVGGLFPLALTLPLDYSANADEAGRLTAMTFFVGYVVAAVGPVAVGALRDATGGYAVSFVALAALSVAMLVSSFQFRPRSALRP